jgi:SPP1 family predicted phage head-tail adaptor
MRFDSVTKTLTPKHNILYDGRSFDIQSVINPQNRNKEIVLICSEVV